MYHQNMRLTSKVLFGIFVLNMTTQAQPVFVDGVTLDGGWYDCNKKHNWNWVAKPTTYYTDSFPDDNSMCWAHSASNILQWWQDRQDASLLPSAAPNGASNTATVYRALNPNTGVYQYFDDTLHVQQLAIFKDVAANWSNTPGTVKQVYNWYFNGGYVPDFGGNLTNQNSGGYYADLGLRMNDDGVTSSLFTSYTFNDYFTKVEVTDALTGYIDNNYGTTLRVIGAVGGHAITMWGYEFINDDFYVYLTDSDDLQHALIKQKVIFGDNLYVYLTACDGDAAVYTDSYTTFINGEQQTFQGILLSEAQAFMAPKLSIPEPSTATLAMLSLTALLARRRRKS